MADVPKYATYKSDDSNLTIKIEQLDASTGTIRAVYNTTYSPQGAFSDPAAPGTYAWVFSDQQGKDGVAPFDIRVTGSVRPDKRPYCIVDTWSGAYQTDNSLLLAGSRAYVNSKGVVQVTSLGTHRFAS